VRTIVVSGAAGGLGAALARRFSSEPGTRLVLTDLDISGLRRVATDLEEDVELVLVAGDVCDPASMENVVGEAVDRFGTLDVMINNAGILSPNARLHNVTPEQWERVISVNLLGVVNGMNAALTVMRPQRTGSIVNTASVAGISAWPYSAPYGAAKAAVIHLTRIAAVEYAGEGIRVNCVCPGLFSSGMTSDVPAEALAAVTARHPLGAGTTDDLVGAYSYLASDDSRWTTGHAFIVDGGYSAP
jgi:3-oxoacyl-[acyl-carrier protein] reductase